MTYQDTPAFDFIAKIFTFFYRATRPLIDIVNMRLLQECRDPAQVLTFFALSAIIFS